MHHARQCRSFLHHGQLQEACELFDCGGGGRGGNDDHRRSSHQSMPAAELSTSNSIPAVVASRPDHYGGSGHSQPVLESSSIQHIPAAAASNLADGNASDDFKLQRQHHTHCLTAGTADYSACHSSEITSTDQGEAAGTADNSTRCSSDLTSSNWNEAASHAAEQAGGSPAACPAMSLDPAGHLQSQQMGKQASQQQTANDPDPASSSQSQRMGKQAWLRQTAMCLDPAGCSQSQQMGRQASQQQTAHDLDPAGHAAAQEIHDPSPMLPTADGTPAGSSERQQPCQQAPLQQQIGGAAGPPAGACAGVFVDGFAGVGGNAVQAALAGFQVRSPKMALLPLLTSYMARAIWSASCANMGRSGIVALVLRRKPPEIYIYIPCTFATTSMHNSTRLPC